MTRYAYSVMVLVLSVFFLAGGYQIALGEEGGMKDKALDAKITTSVKGHLAKDDRLKTLTQISVKTVDKIVTLTGTVPTQQEKDMAEKVASGVEHVQKVVNNIEVRP
jgi:hyperosmotically inducible periplasmic protein